MEKNIIKLMNWLFEPIKDLTPEKSYEKSDFKLCVPLSEIIEYKTNTDSSIKNDTRQLKKPSEDKIKLSDSGVYVFIDNFAKKYRKCFYKNEIPLGSLSPDTAEVEEKKSREVSAMMANELTTLQKFLKSKGFTFTVKELHLLLSEAAINQEYKDFEKKILFNKPEKLEDYVVNLLEAYGDRYETYLEFLQILMDLRGIKVGINQIMGTVEEARESLKLRHFESKFGLNSTVVASLDEIDSMTGYEFESLLKQLFEKMGFTVKQTKLSGDQGADLVVNKLDEITVIQAKRSNSKIGNDAIQEVVASMGHYNAQKGIVMSNNYYTPSAIELARSNNIILIDRDKLRKLVEEYL
jgi:hypothetical protein